MSHSSGGGTASWPPEMVIVLLFIWFRKANSVQISGAWHPALVFRPSLAWAESVTAAGNPGYRISVAVRDLMKNLG